MVKVVEWQGVAGRTSMVLMLPAQRCRMPATNKAAKDTMADPVEAFIDRVRSVEPLPRGSNRRLAIRQKIAESESALRMDRDAALALPAFRQRARDRAFKEISRHTRNKVPTRTAEFFKEVFEELSVLALLTIKAQEDDDTFRVEVETGGADAPRPRVAKSGFYSLEAARQWIDSDQGNTLIKAIIEKYAQ